MAEQKTALIIGASRGLGLGLVQQFSQLGWQVTATVRTPSRADELKAVNGVKIATLDIDSNESLAALGQQIKNQVFDLIFVNAGVLGPEHQSAAAATYQELAQLFMTNVTAPIRLAEALVGQLRPNSGVLAFMSSILGSVKNPEGNNLALYKASKAALNSLTNSFICSLPEPRPTVLSLHPGWVRTAMGGPNAEIDVATSCSGLAAQVQRFAGKGGHHFVDYQGQTIPW
ncbi:SDR family oxidoreductase [Pseudomonas sp. EL_65y_Pfl2_R95]|uniref:SDR family oxidoreductase n=1 Tax=Pseudomonas sp. EL_65y_Pfl2_R95 TaxID=3088698 RepID=UPI0030D9B899